jgi:apolipoprotein N-acyltransferase
MAVASGLLIALSLPPFGWWPLGPIGLAGFAALLAGTVRAPWWSDEAPSLPGGARGMRARAAIGAGVGLGQYGLGLWWATEFNGAGYLALVAHGMLAMALAAVIVPARRRWGVLFGLPAAVLVADWLRGHVPLNGLTIGGLAIGQAGGPLVASARLGGTLLVTAVTALAGTGLAEVAAAAVRLWRRQSARRVVSRLGRAAVALAVVVAMVAAGRLGPDGAGPGPHQTLRVAVVQGGGRRGLSSLDVDPSLVFQRQVSATRTIEPPVDLVLWPEDVVHVDQPVDQTPEGAELGTLSTQLGTTLVAGVVEDVGTDSFRNAAIAWGPTGTIVARYDKVHRVPFGEYVPARSLIRHVVNLGLVPRDAVPGHGPGLLDTPAGPLGVAISYEVFFEDRVRAGIRAGGQVLLVPTNASSYLTTQIPSQEVAAARLAAWETGRDTLQAAPTGYSAVIGHDGQVRSRTALGRQQVIEATVERRTGQTLFVRLGDLPFVIAALAGLAVSAVRWRRLPDPRAASRLPPPAGSSPRPAVDPAPPAAPRLPADT